MKKIVLIFNFCLMVLSCYAQGNLQFNQVKFLTMETTAPTSTAVTVYGSQSITVPTGKVWKIESVGVNNYYNSTSSPTLSSTGNPSLSIDGRLIWHATAPFSYMPLWLPEGTYTVRFQGYCSNTEKIYGFISALEFNVIP